MIKKELNKLKEIISTVQGALLLRAKREFGFDFENSYYRTAKTIIKDYSDKPKFKDN